MLRNRRQKTNCFRDPGTGPVPLGFGRHLMHDPSVIHIPPRNILEFFSFYPPLPPAAMSHLAPASIVRPHKTSMAELKLRRLNEHNARLREDLARPRARVSEASISLIKYCSSTKDPLLPSVWGPPGKGEDPYAPPDIGCCTSKCSLKCMDALRGRAS